MEEDCEISHEEGMAIPKSVLLLGIFILDHSDILLLIDKLMTFRSIGAILIMSFYGQNALCDEGAFGE